MWLHQNKHQGSMKNILKRGNKIKFKMKAKEKEPHKNESIL
jgi:hypothetical protein